MRGQPRQEQDGRAVDIGRDTHAAGKRRAIGGIENRQCSVARGPDQRFDLPYDFLGRLLKNTFPLSHQYSIHYRAIDYAVIVSYRMIRP